MNRQNHRGFTLIELMIAVAIVAILASVAIPAYRDYVRRGQLPEAFTYLSDYRVKMEQYYQDYRSYGTDNGGACANGANLAWNGFAPQSAKYFTFACTVAAGDDGTAAQKYTLTATGNAGAVVGHVYTLNNANAQATTQFKGEAVAKACWLIKGSEC